MNDTGEAIGECLDPGVAAEFIEGRMSRVASSTIESHLDSCPDCRAMLVGAARLAALTVDGEAAPQPTSSGESIESEVAATTTWAPPARFDEYRIVRELGHGAMGRVFLARDESLERLVAVKFIVTADPDANSRARFLVEARAAARLHHPNVVSVFRIGELAGLPYIVSEYVQGKSLREVATPAPGSEVLRLGLALARGLAAAHGRGVLHRDIKPGNVIVGEDGEVKLLDFGLAKLVERDPDGPLPEDLTNPGVPDLTRQRSLTRANAIVGTPAYMAPELWLGEAATPSSDVYGLGLVLFELCAGSTPFRGTPLRELPAVVRERPAPRLRSVRHEVDPDLASIVDRCLERDPSQRFRSAEELLAALERVGRLGSGGVAPAGEQHQASAHTPGIEPPTEELTVVSPRGWVRDPVAALGRTSRGDSARRLRAFLGWVAAAVLAIAVGLLLWAQRGPEAEPSNAGGLSPSQPVRHTKAPGSIWSQAPAAVTPTTDAAPAAVTLRVPAPSTPPKNPAVRSRRRRPSRSAERDREASEALGPTKNPVARPRVGIDELFSGGSGAP